MKLLALSLPALLLAAQLFAADFSQIITEASRYESGASAELLRQIERAVRESAGNAAQRAEVETGLVRLLAPSATFEARRFACTQLASMGTETSLSAIGELLKEADTVGMACLALGSNPSPKANALLRSALAGTTGPARVQIITTLGDRGDAEAARMLGALARAPEREVAEAALSALGKIANGEALAVLAAQRQGYDGDRVRAAVAASLVGADNAARRGNAAAAAGIYSELLAAGQPVYVRRAALEGLLRTDADGGEQRILTVLRGTDSEVKPSALVQVRTLKSPAASARFAKELAALAPAERVLMIESLAARNDDAGRAAITSQLLAGDAAVRQAAVMAFATMGDASSVAPLAAALGRISTPEEQQTLELAMASLKGGAAVDAQITSLVKAGGAAPKAGLINVLARRGSQGSTPVLLDAAASPDPGTAKAAFRALGKLAGPGDLEAVLGKLVELKNPAVRGEAETAAAKVIERVADVDRRATAVTSALARTRDMDARCALLGLLPVCGGAQALSAVKAARADQASRIREAAMRALAEWPDALAVDPLMDMAQSAAQNTERVLALRGCVRLLGSGAEVAAPAAAARFKQLLAVTKNAEEKKLVLSGLANVPDPTALGLATALLGESDLSAEAAQTVVRLAARLCGAFREPARSAVQKVVDLPVDKDLRQTARDLLEVSGEFGDFLMAWEVTGPYALEGNNGQALFDRAFPPEQAGAPNVKWQIMPAGALKARPWQLDLGKLYGGDHRVAYARTWVYSETAQPARLELGSDDGIKAWLNGKVVVTANRGGDVAPGAEKAQVALQQGWNSLLLKVTQWTSGWGFCARLAKPDGTPLPGVRTALNLPNQ